MVVVVFSEMGLFGNVEQNTADIQEMEVQVEGAELCRKWCGRCYAMTVARTNGSARRAIAVHDIHTVDNKPNAELFLSNVNLVGNNTISGHTTDPADIWLLKQEYSPV